MVTQPIRLQQRYTRSDPKGHFPRLAGYPGIEHNRLGTFWRPIIDMTDSPYSAMRLRMIRPVNDWLADPATPHRSWFAMIGVPGLRRQVIRHSGLHDYDCNEPAGLPEHLQTPAWRRLTSAISHYQDLGDNARCLVVFQLAQLSLTGDVFALAGDVQPSGVPDHDRYAYEVARVHVRYPSHARYALPIFDSIASSPGDPVLALAAATQGAAHAIRDLRDTALAQKFAKQGRQIIVSSLPDGWQSWLVESRYHRAIALVQLAERNPAGMRDELAKASSLADAVLSARLPESDRMAAVENRRILLETTIRAATRGGEDESGHDSVLAACAELSKLDPYCVEALLVIGDGYAAVQDCAEAARFYCLAGQLGTASGAVGWFRAAQCYEILGERWEALNSMGRCLELDASAIEPKEYFEKHARP